MPSVTGRLHNRIDLLWSGQGFEEARSYAVCWPGTLLAMDINGKVGPHGTDAVCNAARICLHQQKLGALITESFAIDTLVPYVVPRAGDCFNMLVESAQDITLDDFLTVTNSGTLRVAGGADVRLFQPLEVLAGTGSGDRFCKCRFIR